MGQRCTHISEDYEFGINLSRMGSIVNFRVIDQKGAPEIEKEAVDQKAWKSTRRQHTRMTSPPRQNSKPAPRTFLCTVFLEYKAATG